MHTFYKRIEFLFSTASSFGFMLLLAVSLSNFWLSRNAPTPSIDLSLKRILFSRGPTDYYVSQVIDSPEFVMSLRADLTPLFHWNCKEVFLYIKLEYISSKYNCNEIVIWDKIVTHSDAKVINLQEFVSKYRVADIAGDFYGKKGKLRLYWNTVPFVGLLGTAQAQLGTEVEALFARLKDIAPGMPEVEFQEPVKIEPTLPQGKREAEEARKQREL